MTFLGEFYYDSSFRAAGIARAKISLAARPSYILNSCLYNDYRAYAEAPVGATYTKSAIVH